MRTRHAVSWALAVLVAAGALACQPEQSAGPQVADNGLLSARGPGSGGKGGGDEGFGNNLSYPVILANATGLGGAHVAGVADFAATGFRPLAGEPAFSELGGSPAVPFWSAGNASASYVGTTCVFWQKTANVWQAAWEARSGPVTPVLLDWGDNLRSSKLTTTSVIRVEHVLLANDGTTLQGFPMDITLNPSSPTEQQGIYDDGAEEETVALVPTVFTDRARLTIQKLTGPGGDVAWTYFDKAVYESFGIDGPGGYGAEINVGGKVVYGYVWDLKKVVLPGGLEKAGWWRITFSLDGGSGVAFDALAAGDEVMASLDEAISVAEVELTSKGGGTGKGRR